mgnify:CR=1 FL=1
MTSPLTSSLSRRSALSVLASAAGLPLVVAPAASAAGSLPTPSDTPPMGAIRNMADMIRELHKLERTTRGEVRVTTLAEIGTYLHAIAEAEPRFTGRAVKNITDAIKTRAMDFEMPDEWFETPEPFLHQPYDRKLDMIAALRQPITPAMVVQEINRYADSEWRYAETADESAIEETVRGMERMAEAKRRYEGGEG